MVLCSAIEFCKKTGRILVVDWSDGVFAARGANIFPKFFSIRDFPQTSNMQEILANIGHLSCYPSAFKGNPESGGYDHFVHARNDFFMKLPRAVLINERLKMLHGFWLHSSKAAPASGRAFLKEAFDHRNFSLGHDLSTSHPEDVLFYFDFTPNRLKQTFMNHISLNEDVLKKINSFVSENNLANNSIGVHVRSTDKKPQKPLEALFAGIARLNLKDPKIFLATDNKEISRQVKSKFNAVIEYPKLMPEVRTGGMHLWAKYSGHPEQGERILEESIVDMWLLSKCEYLLYQSNSTFSLISAYLHKEISRAVAWDK